MFYKWIVSSERVCCSFLKIVLDGSLWAQCICKDPVRNKEKHARCFSRENLQSTGSTDVEGRKSETLNHQIGDNSRSHPLSWRNKGKDLGLSEPRSSLKGFQIGNQISEEGALLSRFLSIWEDIMRLLGEMPKDSGE